MLMFQLNVPWCLQRSARRRGLASAARCLTQPSTWSGSQPWRCKSLLTRWPPLEYWPSRRPPTCSSTLPPRTSRRLGGSERALERDCRDRPAEGSPRRITEATSGGTGAGQTLSSSPSTKESLSSALASTDLQMEGIPTSIFTMFVFELHVQFTLWNHVVSIKIFALHS